MDSISDTVEGLVDRWKAVLLAVIGLLVVFSVIQTFIRTRSWVPTIGVIIVGAAALWGVGEVDTIKGKVEAEITDADNFREPTNEGTGGG